MANTLKALEVLGLPEDFAPFDGQVQTRIQRGCWVYENTEIVNGKFTTYYTVEFYENAPQAFGLYVFNHIANLIYSGGFSDMGETELGGRRLNKPSSFVLHESPSGMAGQTVYYVDENLIVYNDRMDFYFEPYETAWKGVADPMVDPMMRVGYKARLITRDANGKPVVKWQSRSAITPKRRLRRAEFLELCGLTMDEVISKMRYTYNIVKTDPSTHINSIAMDLERPTDSTVKSTVYINGEPSNSFNYKTLINSFGQKYGGFIQMYRLYNGPQIFSGENVYGSTLNVTVDPAKDTTINVKAGAVNTYNATSKTLTFNPDLVDVAQLLAYMEFLPANGKNESVGRFLNLENGEETHY
jgi:hypothetical protein